MEIFGGVTVDEATLGDVAGHDVNTTNVGLSPDAVADVLKRLVDNAHHERLRRDADEQERRQRQADLDRQFAHIASLLQSIATAQEALMRIIWILVIGSGGLTMLIMIGVVIGLAVVVWRMG